MLKALGAVSACGRVLGILVCYIIAHFSDYKKDNTAIMVIQFGPAYLAVFQALLIWIFLP